MKYLTGAEFDERTAALLKSLRGGTRFESSHSLDYSDVEAQFTISVRVNSHQDAMRMIYEEMRRIVFSVEGIETR